MTTPKPSSSRTQDESTKNASNTTAVEHLDGLPSNTVETNLDNVLETVKTLDRTCDYNPCKMKTNLMGQNCDYCRNRFCFKHSLPEVHGCGDAVRRDERKKFLHPEPLKTIKHREELAKAKDKLHAKLSDMSLSRKQRQPGTKKSKK